LYRNDLTAEGAENAEGENTERNNSDATGFDMKEEVVEYLTQILENIRDYLDNEEYLELTTGNP